MEFAHEQQEDQSSALERVAEATYDSVRAWTTRLSEIPPEALQVCARRSAQARVTPRGPSGGWRLAWRR
jgi:hypothetical protein